MITLIKLIDGTEIVGESTQTGDKVVVNNPLQINYFVRSPAAPPVISMHRYMPFAGNTKFSFYIDHIVTQTDPKPSMEQFYNATLRDITEYMDPALDTTLSEKADALLEDTGDIAQALIEKMIKKPYLN
jgi:hypothetical protein